MKKNILHRQLGILILSGLLTACDNAEVETPAPLPQVSVTILQPSDLVLTEDLQGRVSALKVAEIRPQVSGIVLRRLFEQGSQIKAGQPLFQINPAPFMAEVDIATATLQRAEAALKRDQNQELRLRPLVQSKAISSQAYDDAVAQKAQAAADVAFARATLARRKLDLKFATVEAPISGRIDQALVTEGALVSSSDSNPMARIQQIDTVYVDVRRPSSSFEALQKAVGTNKSDLGLPVTLLRSNGEPYQVTGRILFSGINVDEGTGDVLLRILVNNSSRTLLPGMFVRARVPLASYPQAITIPEQAVIRMGGKTNIWTIDEKNHAHLTPVQLGELTAQRYRIQSGVSLGQKVVVEGMDRLTENSLVNPVIWAASGSEINTSTH